MLIREETDAVLVNRISNMPEVLPFISRHGDEVDWSPAIGHPDCVILSNSIDACIVFERTAARDWQCTTIFAPSCRGRGALETGNAMRRYMLANHADMVFGSIPDRFRHALWFYRKMGGTPAASVESGGETYVAQENETLLVFRAEIGQDCLPKDGMIEVLQYPSTEED
jgi:hypothetical protein